MDALTLGDFRTRISGAIGLDNSTASDEQLLMDDWINEAVEQFLLETGCKISLATMATTANEGDYTLPTEVLAIRKLWVDDDPDWILEQVSEEDILWYRRIDGTPMRYYSLAGGNLIQVAGAPATAGTLNLSYVPRPTTLTLAASTPTEIPVEFHPYVETYAKWKAAEWDDDTSSQIGESYRKQFELEIRKARSRLNRKGGRMLSPVRAGHRRRRRLGVGNGVDL